MRSKTFVRQLAEHVELHRDPRTGIAWVKNGIAGVGHSCHPNISGTGSVRGMKARGWWHRDDKTVRSHGWIYNISRVVTSDEYDEIARQECRCSGNHS